MERPAAASGFAQAIVMADTGIRLMRQNLRRQDCAATDDEIDARLARWLRDRPMDAPGQVRSFPSR